jgi:uncharacterized membrane protein
VDAADDQEQINEQEWNRPENWSGWLGIYRSEHDTRIWVPKRNASAGWTPNLAHRDGRLFLAALFTVPLGFLLLAILLAIFR